MNSNLIELKNEKERLIKQYIFALIPLMLFGIYKNGINLFLNDVSIKKILLLISYPILGAILGLIIDIINNKKIKLDFNLLIGLMIGLMVPYSCNILIFILSFIILFILNILDKSNNLNHICIISIIIIVGLCLFATFDYNTILEINNKYSYTLLDKFIGFNEGGLFTSSILASLIGFIILRFNKLYKGNIAIISLLIYLVLLLINIPIHSFDATLDLLLNSNNIYILIFIAPLCIFSPIGNKRIITFSIIIGVLSAAISIIGLKDIAALTAILVANIVDYLIITVKNMKNV